ncbi:hypothetical protein PENTCL1PPCAC_8866, partial [Pristionchus entomophagus]
IACTDEQCFCRDHTKHFHVNLPSQPVTYGAILICGGYSWQLVSHISGVRGGTAIDPDRLEGACQAGQPTTTQACMCQMPVVYKGMRDGGVSSE